jgi:CRISPR/Cas system CSM-associated protein Csm3 (group 7 of RAMP superfamily)
MAYEGGIMKIWKISFIFNNDFHTTGELKGSLVDFLKDSENNPYIPATHIKGVMRTEAERILRSIENIPCYITGKPKIILCEEVKKGEYKCDVCRIFGAPNNRSEYKEGKIRVTDFRTEIEIIGVSRMHVSIERDRQIKSKEALFNILSVPSKTEFSGHIFIRQDLTESESKLLMASIHSMCHYGLGKERSRGLGGLDNSLEGMKITEITQEEYLGVK